MEIIKGAVSQDLRLLDFSPVMNRLKQSRNIVLKPFISKYSISDLNFSLKLKVFFQDVKGSVLLIYTRLVRCYKN